MKTAVEHLKLLGARVRDKITGMEGVVTSLSFDLYGCVQAIVHPGMDKDKKLQELHWFDEKRLEVLDAAPIIEPPNWGDAKVPLARAVAGPESKPPFATQPKQ